MKKTKNKQVINSKFPLDKIAPFKFARLASYFSDGSRPGRKMGSALALRKSVVAVGRNSFTRTHTIQGNGVKPFIHAEIDVIVKRRHYDGLEKHDLYVYREDMYGMPALARPCPQCMKLIIAFGIKRIFYTIAEEPYYEVIKL